MKETPATDERPAVEPATPDPPVLEGDGASRTARVGVRGSSGSKPRRATLLVVGTVVVAGVDLLTKLWASTVLRTRDVELPEPLDLRLSHNTGAAFGAFAALPAPLIVTVTAAVTVGLIVAGLRGVVSPLPCVLIAGGALGNVIDRAHGGSVVDLLHTGWWPTFNFADVFITVGAVLLAVGALRTGAHRSGRSPEPV